jgi:sulfur carrier protein ThiS
MKIKFVAPIRMARQDTEGTLEIPDGTTVRKLLRRTGVAGRMLAALPIMVNGNQVKPTFILHDGDVVVVVMPLSGG